MQILIKRPHVGQLIYSPKGFTGKVVAVRSFDEVFNFHDPDYIRGVKDALRENLGENYMQTFFEADILVLKTEPPYKIYEGQIEVLTYGEFQNCNVI